MIVVTRGQMIYVEDKDPDYLSKVEIPNQIKREIFHNALLLIVYNALLFRRPDKHYFILSCIGVLLSFIPLDPKKKYYFVALASFTFVFHDFPILFYTIYGYILTSTYQNVSILFLCLSPRCIAFLRQIEVMCCLLPCITPVSYNYPVFAFFVFSFVNTFLLKIQPILFNSKKNPELSKYILPAIRSMILIDDYILMAREQREVMSYHVGTPIKRSKNLINFIDIFPSVFLANIPLLMKAWVFFCVLIPVQKIFHLNFLFFFFMLFEMYELLVGISAFCDWGFKVYPKPWYISITMLVRVIIAYCIYLISVAYLE